jgi:hypothetical protein
MLNIDTISETTTGGFDTLTFESNVTNEYIIEQRTNNTVDIAN